MQRNNLMGDDICVVYALLLLLPKYLTSICYAALFQRAFCYLIKVYFYAVYIVN